MYIPVNMYDNFDKTALYFTRATMPFVKQSFSCAKIYKDLLNYNNDPNNSDDGLIEPIPIPEDWE